MIFFIGTCAVISAVGVVPLLVWSRPVSISSTADCFFRGVAFRGRGERCKGVPRPIFLSEVGAPRLC